MIFVLLMLKNVSYVEKYYLKVFIFNWLKVIYMFLFVYNVCLF